MSVLTTLQPPPVMAPGPASAEPLLSRPRRRSSLFRRVTAQAMGMEADALCHKSHWVPKSSRAHCANCKRGFRLLNAKHHCRLCGEVVCGACSTKRILFQKKSVRSCDECIHANVQTISAINRSNSALASGLDDVSSSSSSDEAPQERQRRQGARPRRRRQETLSQETSAVLLGAPESWRVQAPYALVLMLLAIASVTNVLAWL